MNLFIIHENLNKEVESLVQKISTKFEKQLKVYSYPLSMDLFEEEPLKILKEECFAVIIDTRKQCCEILLAHHGANLVKELNRTNKTLAILLHKPLTQENMDEVLIVQSIRDDAENFLLTLNNLLKVSKG